MRPRVAFAFYPGMEDLLLGADQRAALDAVATIVDPEALGSFDDARSGAVLGEVDVLLTGWGCPPVDGAALARAPDLRLVAHAAGTVKDVVTDAVWERGVRVSSAAVANAVPVAEFTLGAILLANKRAFWAAHRYRRTREWPGLPLDAGNVGKQVGIVGASHVGRLVVGLLAPFDLEVVIADPYLDEAGAAALGARLVDLDELLATSDVVSLHAPLLPETVGLIGEAEIDRLRDGAVLVNTARGRIVDHDALAAALAAGRIYAVVDTTDPEPLPADSPLLDDDRAFVTPHLAGSAGREIRRMADVAVAEIARFAADAPLAHEVTVSDLGRIA